MPQRVPRLLLLLAALLLHAPVHGVVHGDAEAHLGQQQQRPDAGHGQHHKQQYAEEDAGSWPYSKEWASWVGGNLSHSHSVRYVFML